MNGVRVNRITWLPGTDLLVGTCYCGAVTEADDPVQMWAWLLAHPDHPDHRDHRDLRDHPERPGSPAEP